MLPYNKMIRGELLMVLSIGLLHYFNDALLVY